jgi:hypothetical protein
MINTENVPVLLNKITENNDGIVCCDGNSIIE